jgi:ribonuclease J
MEDNTTGGNPSTPAQPANPGAAKPAFTHRSARGGRGRNNRTPRAAGAPGALAQPGTAPGGISAFATRSRPSSGGKNRRPRHGGPKPHQAHPPREVHESTPNPDDKPIPPLAPGNIRIIPLGGVEEIGRNMTIIEMNDDIIIVDCGFQFREDDTPGIDYILPNTKYLEDRQDKIRGMFITHGHLDHIGAIPYVIDLIGYPTIYTRQLSSVMIRKRQEEFPHLKPLEIHEVEKEDTVRVGGFKVRFFSVSHTIPDAMGIIIETPYGDLVFTGDLRLDHIDGIPSAEEEKEFAVFKERKVLFLAADSTNAEKPGFSLPERSVQKNLDDIIVSTQTRLIIGTFSSQLERIMRMLEAAERAGKKVLVEGRSMKVNIEIVKQLGMLKVSDKLFIDASQLEQLPDNKIVVLGTGAQGDEFAALMRIAMKTHKSVKIKKGDTVVLSSSVIPGNERSVQKLKDNLSRQGARIIHRDMADVHASGHANRDETFWIHSKINPRFFMPLHGYHYMLRVHADIARACGRAESDIVVPDNSCIIEIQDEGQKIVRLKEMAPAGLRLVDGFSIGDIQEVVIRDRTVLAQEGMFVIIATVNPKTGHLRKSPDIISRGFIYLRESQDLLQQTRMIIKKTIEDSTKNQQPVNFDFVKNNVTDAVARYLFEKTNKRPIVIPVILGM